MKKVRMVNRCGVSQDSFVNGKCMMCGRSVCDISEDTLIDERIWNLAQKIGATPNDYFDDFRFVKFMEDSGKLKKVPKYVQNYVVKVKENLN